MVPLDWRSNVARVQGVGHNGPRSAVKGESAKRTKDYGRKWRGIEKIPGMYCKVSARN